MGAPAGLYGLGIDVGSTTVKCVVVDAKDRRVLWRRYERHGGRQAEKLSEMLTAIAADHSDLEGNARAFITGSGGGPMSEPLGARYVQEVNAVSVAAEALHPDANTVIELGGQDAKFILFKRNPETGERGVVTNMNDKCASGTGATIDKCMAKVGLKPEAVAKVVFDPSRLHRVAARCGIFAETDVVNLIKAGVDPKEVMNSLGDAIVMQNLTVLARGHTLAPKVLLLGGPNTFLPLLRDSWRLRIGELWRTRGVETGEEKLEDLIFTPEDSLYFAALGAVLFGLQRTAEPRTYRGLAGLQTYIAGSRRARLGEKAGPPIFRVGEDKDEFVKAYTPAPFEPKRPPTGGAMRGYVGLDGGSTTSKVVLIDENGDLAWKEYRISRGNPIQDAKELLANLKAFYVDGGGSLEILGFGATGYAADVLDAALHADANIVETVAHMLSAKRYCGDDIDVVCDVGGQDIKVLFLRNGVIKDFRLSSQCSAGNGMLLQSMADQFGVPVSDFASIAFKAELSPRFTAGCGVFLDTDRVNYQKEGYTREELFAGLALVLPKNIWQHVVQVPRLAEFGRTFVLQGGTQRNLAALKAQIDYIKARVPDARVLLHPHCGEAGAIGAALEARRVVERRKTSTFIGLDSAIGLQFTTRTDETTRCHFCTNECRRTFIDIRTPDGKTARYIAGFSCERGTVESDEEVRRINDERKRLMTVHPNLMTFEGDYAFRSKIPPASLPEAGSPTERTQVESTFFTWRGLREAVTHGSFERSGAEAAKRRQEVRIGIPRALNCHVVAPFMRAYLETLGVLPRNIVFSPETSADLWRESGGYAAIDPCYPAKAALAHVHDLLVHPRAGKPLDFIWFPAVKSVANFVTNLVDSLSCPVIAGTPKVVEAALTKEKDLFAEKRVDYVTDVLEFYDPPQLERQLFAAWGERLGVTADENAFATARGWAALRACDAEFEARGRTILEKAEKEGEVVLLVLGRTYHNDPGMNHKVPDEFQALGYPIITIRSLPKDPAWLARWFERDLQEGRVDGVFDIRDVWPENFSDASVQTVWAAKLAARHPNIAVLHLSSFKCGNDPVPFALVDRILSEARTPLMALHDLDANKPGASIKIRTRTYAYSLALYRERLADAIASRTKAGSDRGAAAAEVDPNMMATP